MSLPPHGDWLHQQLPPDAIWQETRIVVPNRHHDLTLRWAAVPIGDRVDRGARLFDGERCFIGAFSIFTVESQRFTIGKMYHRCGPSKWFNCTWLLAVLAAERIEKPASPDLWRSSRLDTWIRWQYGPDPEGLWKLSLSLRSVDRSAWQYLIFDGMSPVVSWSHDCQDDSSSG